MTGLCGEAAAGLEKSWAQLISRDTDKATLNLVLSTGTKAPLAISGNQTGELPAGVSWKINSVPSLQVSPSAGKGPGDLLELGALCTNVASPEASDISTVVGCSGDSLQLLQTPRVVSGRFSQQRFKGTFPELMEGSCDTSIQHALRSSGSVCEGAPWRSRAKVSSTILPPSSRLTDVEKAISQIFPN